MDWIQVAAIAGSTIGACWVMHRENVRMHQEFTKEFGKEMKDFHGRLCALEEKYIQIMQRILEKNQ
jgi:hypothetical protein